MKGGVFFWITTEGRRH